MSEVVITGIGPISSIGIGASAFDTALRSGCSGISRITSFDPSGFPHQNAGEVHAFLPEDYLHRIDVRRWGRSSLFAAAAARLAALDAGLDVEAVPPGRVAAVVGTTSGEPVVSETLTSGIVERGIAAIDADISEMLPANRLSNAVCAELGASGESLTIGTACSASNYAIGYGYDLLCSGAADVVYAGGADAMCRWAHAGFYRLGALAKDACAPFDRDRSGILTGEGGAMIVLETAEHAAARGRRPRAVVRGYAANCDAKHPVAPDAAGIAACMRLAHANADVTPDQIDYICAHGTGTPANDATEVAAIREVFGSTPPPVSSIKSMLGHTMGASSGFGVIACVLAINGGYLPPTINWSHTDDALGPLDVVPNRARPGVIRFAQNDGFAFAGNNAIVVLAAA